MGGLMCAHPYNAAAANVVLARALEWDETAASYVRLRDAIAEYRRVIGIEHVNGPDIDLRDQSPGAPG